MKVKYYTQYENSYYACDICGKKIIQDGKDICLIQYPENYKKVPKDKQGFREYALHFHSSCLLKWWENSKET